VNDAYVSNVDLAATLCDVGGCQMGPYPSGYKKSDGFSFLDAIVTGGRGPVRTALYEEHREPLGYHHNATPPWRAIRTTTDSPLGLWHYVEYDYGFRELYDTSGGPCRDWQVGDPGDPCELTNLASDPAHATLVATLSAQLHANVKHVLPSVP